MNGCVSGPAGLAASCHPERLKAVAGRHGATTSQLALAYLLARSPVMLAIPGTGSLSHLAENMGAARIRLTPRTWLSWRASGCHDRIAEISAGHVEEAGPAPFLR